MTVKFAVLLGLFAQSPILGDQVGLLCDEVRLRQTRFQTGVFGEQAKSRHQSRTEETAQAKAKSASRTGPRESPTAGPPKRPGRRVEACALLQTDGAEVVGLRTDPEADEVDARARTPRPGDRRRTGSAPACP